MDTRAFDEHLKAIENVTITKFEDDEKFKSPKLRKSKFSPARSPNVASAATAASGRFDSPPRITPFRF